MRLQSLKQTANRYLKINRQGSFKQKQHRAFVIHKLIHDLFVSGNIPASWRGLKSMHIQNLVQHWENQKIKPATIMRYMSDIRCFLSWIDCPISGIDNQSLNLKRQYKSKKKSEIQPNIWQIITEPSARYIMALQTQFGLTFSEAIHCIPDIHFREDSLWITRDIAFNSEDRVIPLRNETQKAIITDISIHTSGYQNLIQRHGYNEIHYQWRQALSPHRLLVNKRYRYLYAQQLMAELSTVLGHYQLCWLIRNEMGIKSRNTLWSYLNE